MAASGESCILGLALQVAVSLLELRSRAWHRCSSFLRTCTSCWYACVKRVFQLLWAGAVLPNRAWQLLYAHLARKLVPSSLRQCAEAPHCSNASTSMPCVQPRQSKLLTTR